MRLLSLLSSVHVLWCSYLFWLLFLTPSSLFLRTCLPLLPYASFPLPSVASHPAIVLSQNHIPPFTYMHLARHVIWVFLSSSSDGSPFCKADVLFHSGAFLTIAIVYFISSDRPFALVFSEAFPLLIYLGRYLFYINVIVRWVFQAI